MPSFCCVVCLVFIIEPHTASPPQQQTLLLLCTLALTAALTPGWCCALIKVISFCLLNLKEKKRREGKKKRKDSFLGDVDTGTDLRTTPEEMRRRGRWGRVVRRRRRRESRWEGAAPAAQERGRYTPTALEEEDAEPRLPPGDETHFLHALSSRIADMYFGR